MKSLLRLFYIYLYIMYVLLLLDTFKFRINVLTKDEENFVELKNSFITVNISPWTLYELL